MPFCIVCHCLVRLHYPRDCRQISRTGGISVFFFWLCSTRVKSVLACINGGQGIQVTFCMARTEWSYLNLFPNNWNHTWLIFVSHDMSGMCGVGETKLLFRYLLQVLRYLLRSLIEHESCHKRSQQVTGMQMYKPAEFIIWFLCQLTLFHSHWLCTDTVPSFGVCISCWLPIYDLWCFMISYVHQQYVAS